MERIIIYTRVSSLGDRQNCQRQIADLTKYAQSNGMEIIKVFEEHISGAKANNERNILNEAISYAKTEGISMILFSELSRLGRNVLNVIEIVKYLSDNHINAYFQKENLTLLDDKGKVQPTTTILISCLGMVAEIERENIKFRLNSGRQNAIKHGKRMGRKVGYRMSHDDYEAKYPITIKYLRKGYKMTEILPIAQAQGEKISLPTIKRLKKLQTVN